VSGLAEALNENGHVYDDDDEEEKTIKKEFFVDQYYV